MLEFHIGVVVLFLGLTKFIVDSFSAVRERACSRHASRRRVLLARRLLTGVDLDARLLLLDHR